jgi:hypothetical protein
MFMPIVLVRVFLLYIFFILNEIFFNIFFSFTTKIKSEVDRKSPYLGQGNHYEIACNVRQKCTDNPINTETSNDIVIVK